MPNGDNDNDLVDLGSVTNREPSNKLLWAIVAAAVLLSMVGIAYKLAVNHERVPAGQDGKVTQ